MINKNVLLLQGPMGPFFKRFATELEQKGARVTKVNFNSGDWIFFPQGRSYKGSYHEWIEYIERLVTDENIDKVFLFGDERPYHKLAINKVFTPKGIDVYVFEEGYLRPSFITLEENGVNGNSKIPKNAATYDNKRATESRGKSEKPVVKGQFFKSMLFSVIYGLAKAVGSFSYRKYQHHRCLSPSKQGVLWLWGWLVKKPYYHFSERRSYQTIRKSFNKKYFFVPLQVHNDFQISHSPYKDVKEFIEETVVSFAHYAPKDTVLVLKHHPMDRPYRNYKKFLQTLSDEYQLAGRLFYLHDQHLPTLLRNALGTITINSTVGLSSLYHRIPVLVKGSAVYDISGLTSQLSLEEFWQNQEGVDADLYQNFRLYLLQTNQGHGSFYQKGYNNTPTGIYWPSSMDMFRIGNLLNENESVSILSQRLNKPSVVQVVASGSD
ncbi:MAG: capsular biosynthesis protein [Cocleimonas sp.]|nr:capsular biosynthesis protein [Cocleimonas sp.]